MMSTRFAVAVHTLAYLHEAKGETVRSDAIAQSVNTNPVVVRRILASLSRAGLVTTQLGTGGGSRLSRPADEITLLQVHAAVENGPLFKPHRTPPNDTCPVGAHILPVFDRFTSRAERAMHTELSKVTLGQISRSVARARRNTRT